LFRLAHQDDRARLIRWCPWRQTGSHAFLPSCSDQVSPPSVSFALFVRMTSRRTSLHLPTTWGRDRGG
jgi:hypothetical protein